MLKPVQMTPGESSFLHRFRGFNVSGADLKNMMGSERLPDDDLNRHPIEYEAIMYHKAWCHAMISDCRLARITKLAGDMSLPSDHGQHHGKGTGHARSIPAVRHVGMGRRYWRWSGTDTRMS